jgi:hypothetical protein
LHVSGGKKDVAQDDLVVLDPEALVAIGAAKGAAVMGATQRDLKEDAVRLARRPDAIPFIMHTFIFGNESHYFSPLAILPGWWFKIIRGRNPKDDDQFFRIN